MHFEAKRILNLTCVAIAACFFAGNAQAQSGTRGGFSAPAASAPIYSAPAQRSFAPANIAPAPTYNAPIYTAPAPQVNSYQAPLGGSPIATGSGCSGPGCSGNIASTPNVTSFSPGPVYQSQVVYPSAPVYQSQPIYSSGYSGYPVNSYRRSYAPVYSNRSYYSGFGSYGCGN